MITKNNNTLKKALDQILPGKSLFGKDGAFAPMLKGYIEKTLDVEMASHLTNAQEKNKRNGKGKKTLKTNISEIEIVTPTDRNNSFESSIVKKRQTILADNLSEKIIGLYCLGMSLRDICPHIEEIYDM